MTNEQPVDSPKHEPCFYELYAAELLTATLPFVAKALELTARRDGVHDGATAIMRVELGDLRKLLKATAPRAVPRDVHASPPAPSGWQPIETAPSDGFFIVHQDAAMRMMWRSRGEWQATAVALDRYGDATADIKVCETGVFEPTHWMPLPPAPEASPAVNLHQSIPAPSEFDDCATHGQTWGECLKAGRSPWECFGVENTKLRVEADASPAKDPIAAAVDAQLVDGERTRDQVVRDVLKLVTGYLAKQPLDRLVSDGAGVATWGELRNHLHGAFLLMERGR